MSNSFTLDSSGLTDLIRHIESGELRDQLEKLPQEKAIVALVAQAIAENFRDQGPGWKALKPQTIRASVSKQLKKKLSKLTRKEVREFEDLHRKKGKSSSDNDRLVSLSVKMGAKKNLVRPAPARKILNRTGLLKQSATTPGGPHNIYRQEGTNLVYGTDLKYAAIHNYGGIIKHPGTTKGFGKNMKIPPHNIDMPKREYLLVKDKWMKQIDEYLIEKIVTIVEEYLSRG